jgi:hypothetical protein
VNNTCTGRQKCFVSFAFDFKNSLDRLHWHISAFCVNARHLCSATAASQTTGLRVRMGIATGLLRHGQRIGDCGVLDHAKCE